MLFNAYLAIGALVATGLAYESRATLGFDLRHSTFETLALLAMAVLGWPPIVALVVKEKGGDLIDRLRNVD